MSLLFKTPSSGIRIARTNRAEDTIRLGPSATGGCIKIATGFAYQLLAQLPTSTIAFAR